MAGVETAGRRLVAVAFFGDGQRDDPRVARRKPLAHLLALIAAGTSTSRTLPTIRRRTPAGLFSIAVYRPSCGIIRSRTSGERRLTPQMPHVPGTRKRIVGVHRLVRAMECTNAQMDDTDAAAYRPHTPAARPIAARGRAWQRTASSLVCRRASSYMPGCGASLTRETSCVGLTKRSAISSQTSVTTM